MDKKLLADIAVNTINAILKEIDAVTSDDDMNYIIIAVIIDAVTSDDDMNYIVIAVMGQIGLWVRR